ncbi:RHS repeat-associated core domain-containing protein [Actinacidiphila bryophytorum]|uniref:Deoxyribonuclease RhsC n=2 Tax=Actinacidiphila bryophytorum TaxID=1436133 RepID=A0A9W4M9J7_9ACTN|nr:RHS repeat-associated core domain-containing protein [Actinacidiphila bryophytorum]CAG7640649.1 Deoxyribonuclease RhsC [Actinacidiphila bryophytorum]
MSVEDEAKKLLMKMGMWWPDANSGTLRAAAGAWRTFAGSVDDVRTPVNNAATSLIHNNKGESIAAFGTFWGRYAGAGDTGWLSDLAKSARGMADALDAFADAVDDAINKLWTQIGIDATVIVAGIGLAFFTAGISAAASAAATDAIIDLAGTLGIAVSTTVAEIAGTTLAAAAFGGMESVTVDLAIAQPLKIATGLQQGLSLDEVNEAAESGMIFGGGLGGVTSLAKAAAGLDGADILHSLPWSRPSVLRPDLVDLGPAARQTAQIPCVGEPVDVATGAMVMTQTDLTLPGTLPLVFRRTHMSSFRAGLCFGSSWASTLDEHIQLDAEGAVFAAADGMRLVYPIPRPGGAVLPAKGVRWPLEWDGRPDGVMTVTDPDSGVVRSFSTPVPSGTPGVAHLPLDSWQDRNGDRIDIDRTPEGIPTALRHSGGYHVAVDTAGPRITALRVLDAAPPPYEPPGPGNTGGTGSPGTVVMRYGYDKAGNLAEVVNSSGSPLRFTYDEQGRMTSWTDRNGTTFTYTYDRRGRVVRTDGTGSFLSGRLTYDEESRTTTYRDSLGRESVHRYGAEGLVTEETDPLGHVTRTQWDATLGERTSSTDPLGRTTRYAYDERGCMTAVTRPDGSTAHADHDGRGRPLEVVEPGGATWRYAYDRSGNLLSTTDPLGAVTRRTYDERGHLASVTDALGHTTRIACNAAGLPLAITDPLGGTTSVTRDGFGRIVELVGRLGRSTRLGWTVEGKPAWRQYADGTREEWTWDGEGNLLTHTDRGGRTTRHTVGPFDVPATRTDPDGTTYAFAYDTELRLTGVTNHQGLTWSYVYDAAGRLQAETDFNGRTLTYAHDAANQLVARTNGAAETLDFTRDDLGRITAQRTGAGEVTSYAYGPAGDLVHTRNADAELSIERDALGRTVAETLNGRTTAYTYDPVGRRTSRTTPSGLTSTWTYDAADRPSALATESGSLRFTHDAAGREVERAVGDAAVLRQTWDATDKLTSQSLADGPSSTAVATLQHRTYTYRDDACLSEIRELTSGTRHFDLDAVGRVTGVRAHGWAESYAYDAGGNVTRAAAPGHAAPGARQFTGTLIRHAGRTTYEHDAQGRLIRRTRRLLSGGRKVWTYTWNAEDRLVRTATPAHGTWTYTYDPLGRRLSKSRSGGGAGLPGADRTDFSWDGTCLAEQLAADGTSTTWEYAPGTHVPVAQITRRSGPRRPGTSRLSGVSRLSQPGEAPEQGDPERFHAIVTDAAGTPTELVSARGTLDWEGRTTLWGTRHEPPDADPDADPDGVATDCPLRFQGHYADPETGLHYNHHRYYDPETARYLSPDPLGLEPAPNPHAYAPNPLEWVDPLGLQLCLAAAVKATVLRNSPGAVTGGSRLADVSGQWLKGSAGNAGRIPGQIARALQGREFKSFDDFREAFWEEVSKDPTLAPQFSPSNQTLMSQGKAPFVTDEQAVGGNKRYVLHHVTPIQHGGGVYDLDNLVVVTPQYHARILDPGYHMG